MPSNKLNIYPNELNKPVEKQLEQTNLNFQALSTWSNKIQSEVIVVLENKATNNTSSVSYANMSDFNAPFRTNGSLIRIDSTFCLNPGGGAASIALVIDGQIVREVSISGNFIQLVSFTEVINTYAGSHNLTYQWRVSTGTLTRIANGGSKVIITNLV